jgi:hypothetical protein
VLRKSNQKRYLGQDHGSLLIPNSGNGAKVARQHCGVMEHVSWHSVGIGITTHGSQLEWANRPLRKPPTSLVLFTHISDDSRSIAINRLLEDSAKNKSLVLHYFCDFMTRKQQTDLTIVQSILGQVAEHGDENVVSILSKHRREASSMPKIDVMWRVLDEVCDVHRVFLIIDALDELDTPRTILSRLQSLVAAGGRVLVTSRDHPDLRAALSAGSSVELYSHPEDVISYILYRFRDSDFHHISDTTHTIVEEVAKQTNNL